MDDADTRPICSLYEALFIEIRRPAASRPTGVLMQANF